MHSLHRSLRVGCLGAVFSSMFGISQVNAAEIEQVYNPTRGGAAANQIGSFWRGASWRIPEGGGYGTVPNSMSILYGDKQFEGPTTMFIGRHQTPDGITWNAPATPLVKEIYLFNQQDWTLSGVSNVAGGAHPILDVGTSMRIVDSRLSLLSMSMRLNGFLSVESNATNNGITVSGQGSDSTRNWDFDVVGNATLSSLSAPAITLNDFARLRVQGTTLASDVLGLPNSIGKITANSGIVNLNRLIAGDAKSPALALTGNTALAAITTLWLEASESTPLSLSNSTPASGEVIARIGEMRLKGNSQPIATMGGTTALFVRDTIFDGNTSHLSLSVPTNASASLGDVKNGNTLQTGRFSLASAGTGRLDAKTIQMNAFGGNSLVISDGGTVNLGVDPDPFSSAGFSQILLAADPVGTAVPTLLMNISGAGSVLNHRRLDIGGTGATTINLTAGGAIRGGGIVTDGFSTTFTKQITSVKGATITSTNGEIGFTDLYAYNSVLDFNVGTTLPHTDIFLTDSSFTFDDFTWRTPAGATENSGSYLVAGYNGSSTGTIRNVRADNLTLDTSRLDTPGVKTTNLTIAAGSVINGPKARFSPMNEDARTVAVIRDAGTLVAFGNLGLGATYAKTNPMMPPMVSRGGRADVSVTNGARLVVGGHNSHLGWNSAVNNDVALALEIGSRIEASSGGAVYVGAADSAADYQFNNNAVTVGPGGTILGGGTVVNLINNGGTVVPGFSPGTLLIEGSYVQNSGDLVIEIGGTTQGSFDRLIADAMVFNGGRIVFEPANGFSGSVFTWPILGTSSLTFGSGFNFVTGIVDNTGWGLTFNPLDGSVAQPVPEPASMLLIGLGAVAALKRRKKSAQ